jgi:hypothetical protein
MISNNPRNIIDEKTANEWLCVCLGLDPDNVRMAELRQLPTAAWDIIIQQALKHHLAPLLYHRFNTHGLDATIPPKVLQKLQDIYLASMVRNTRLLHELAQVLTILQNNNIPLIGLKGVHLAETIYDDVALRLMDDIDLLVKKSDLATVRENLQEMGYNPIRHFWIEAETASYDGLPAFTKAEAVPIEIHWNIEAPTSPFKIDIDELWHRAQPVTIAGVKMLALCPEDLLLHLCLHAAYHHQFEHGLRALCDINETIRRYGDEINWEQVWLSARRRGASKPVYLTLYFARELLGTTVPKEVLHSLEPEDLDTELMTWVRAQILTDRASNPPIYNLARVWSAKRLQDKARILLKSIFPSPEVMATMYPVPPNSKRIYLFYPARLKDLLFRYGWIIWRLLRQEEKAIALAEQEDQQFALRDWMASN